MTGMVICDADLDGNVVDGNGDSDATVCLRFEMEWIRIFRFGVMAVCANSVFS